jgi:hypothetical protein
MLIVDAQIHLWAADTPDRPWPPGGAQRAQQPYPVSKDMALAGMKGAGSTAPSSSRPRGRVSATTWPSRRRACIPIDSR